MLSLSRSPRAAFPFSTGLRPRNRHLSTEKDSDTRKRQLRRHHATRCTRLTCALPPWEIYVEYNRYLLSSQPRDFITSRTHSFDCMYLVFTSTILSVRLFARGGRAWRGILRNLHAIIFVGTHTSLTNRLYRAPAVIFNDLRYRGYREY